MMYKKMLSLTLVFALVLSFSAAALAADNSKEETVYALLNEDGSIRSMYVVNSFQNLTKELLDYGSYDAVRNLSTTDALTSADGKVSGAIIGKSLYYEGKLSNKEIPWTVAISYKLDGKDIPAKELAGKSGKVEISVKITQNSKGTAAFYDSYALQISTALNVNLCKNIVAEGATIANVGETKSISYMQLPKKSGDYKITADAVNFEMDPIMISAVPFSMAIAIDGVDNISESLAPLQKGISDLNNGAEKLKNGVKDFGDGLSAVGAQSDTLAGGSSEIAGAIAQIEGLVASLGEAAPPQLKMALTQLNQQYAAFHQGILGYTGGVKTMAQGFAALHSGVTELSKGTATLHNETKNLDKTIQTKVDEALSDFKGDPFSPISFVSESNLNVTAVQFVMKNDAIELPEKAAILEKEPENLSFWEKFLALFK